MENNPNNPPQPQQPPTPVQQPPSMTAPPTTTVPQPEPQPVSPPPQPPEPKKPKSVIKIVLITIAVAVGLFFGSAVIYGFFIGINDAATEIRQEQENARIDEETAVELPEIENAILREIDENLAEQRVTAESFDRTSAYMIFNDNNNFHYIQNANPIRLYDMGEYDPSGECLSQSGNDALSNSEERFEAAGYKTHRSRAYSGGFGCNHTVIASNGEESCSVTLGTQLNENKKNTYNFIISTHCADEEELVEEKEEYREAYQVYVDTALEGWLPQQGEGLNYTPGGFENSATEGYRIAIFSAPSGYSNYFYKKGSDSWVHVKTPDNSFSISCTHSGENASDIRKAFAGQPCGKDRSGIISVNE